MPETVIQFINILLAPFLGLLILFADYHNKRSADVLQNKFFTLIVLFAIIALFSDFMFALVNGVIGNVSFILNWVACTFYFLFLSLSFSMVILTFELILNGNGPRLKRVATSIIVVNAFYTALLAINTFTHQFFYITDENMYNHGPLYFALFVLPVFLVFFMFLNTLLSRKNVTPALFLLAIVSSLPIFTGSLLDVFFSEFLVTWPSFFISLMFFYLFIIRMSVMTCTLTNVHNRRGLDEYMMSIGKTARRNHYAFIIIDMDKFKDINDQFGHAEGDNALRDVAQILRSSVRNRDFVARYGGDEFVIIAISNNVKTMIDKIKFNLEEFNKGGHRPYKLAFSCGGDIYKSSNPCSPSEFFAHVDTLMYAEKNKGENRQPF